MSGQAMPSIAKKLRSDEAGGLPKQKYTTVYSVLSRREKQVGDIINMDGDWAVAEWYPDYQRKSKPPPPPKADVD